MSLIYSKIAFIPLYSLVSQMLILAISGSRIYSALQRSYTTFRTVCYGLPKLSFLEYRFKT
jgi:hypothetical protein